MNQIKIIFIAILFSLLASCEPEKTIIVNDLESAVFWNDGSNNIQTVSKNISAHSGDFVSTTDSSYKYSYLFKTPLKQLSPNPILKISTSTWVKVKSLDARAVIVLSVDSAGVQLKWEGKEITPLIVKANEWTEIKHELIFEDRLNKPEYIFGYYLWNTGNSEVLVDDFTLEILN